MILLLSHQPGLLAMLLHLLGKLNRLLFFVWRHRLHERLQTLLEFRSNLEVVNLYIILQEEILEGLNAGVGFIELTVYFESSERICFI